MSQKLRWGILGTGNIARQFAAGVRASQRGELAAVGSRTPEAARKFAADFGVAAVHGDYRALLEDPAVDAVYVSLPNSLHHPWTLAAMAAGKHVLCEKPLGINAKQAQEMFDAARASKRVLVEAFMYRSHPLTLAVREAVKSGVIGELKLIRTSFCFRTTQIAGNIRFSADLFGGSVMDVGCYCVNFSRLHAECEPDKIFAAGAIYSSGVDEMAAGTMSFPNGILASFVCGMAVQADNTAYLCGDEGYIEIPIPWKPPSEGAIYRVSRGVPPRMDKPAQKAVPLPGSTAPQVLSVPGRGELYGNEADDFAASVLDGQSPRLSEADSLGNMRVLDEMRRQMGVSCGL